MTDLNNIAGARARRSGSSSASELGYEPRAGGTFHPDACSTSDDLVATFRVMLEEKSVQLAKQEGIPDVHRKHVQRVHDSIGPSSRRRRIWREAAKYALGAAVTTLISLFLGSIGKVPTGKGALYIAAACVVVAVLSAPLAFREFLD